MSQPFGTPPTAVELAATAHRSLENARRCAIREIVRAVRQEVPGAETASIDSAWSDFAPASKSADRWTIVGASNQGGNVGWDAIERINARLVPGTVDLAMETLSVEHDGVRLDCATGTLTPLPVYVD